MFTFVFLLWFELRLRKAENRRLRCRHETEAESFKNTALKMLGQTNRLYERHEKLSDELKSLKGSLQYHSKWVGYFVEQHVPKRPNPNEIGEPK